MPYIQEILDENSATLKRVDHWSGFYSTKPALKQAIVDLFKEVRTTSKLMSFVHILQ